MNPQNTNPRFFILESDPGRYIKTTYGAIIAVIKVLEGAVAFLWSFQVLQCLMRLFAGEEQMMPVQLLQLLLPTEMTKAFLPEKIPPAGMIDNILCMVIAACLLVVLVCMVVEAVAGVLLRFAMTGAKALKITHAIIHIAVIIMAIGVAISCVFLVIGFVTSGSDSKDTLRLVIVTIVCVLLLAFRVSYHKGAATVLSAIEYEFRLGFKETAMDPVKLTRDSLLFVLIFIVAAVAFGLFTGWANNYVYCLAILALKYFAVYNSWGDFQRCHM